MKSLIVIAISLFVCVALQAHPAPHSELLLRPSDAAISASLILPLSELELALKKPLPAKEKAFPLLRKYLAERIHPESPDGKKWTVEIGDLELKPDTRPIESDSDPSNPHEHVLSHPRMVIAAALKFIPPPGELISKFNLEYTVIHHEVMSHRTYVLLAAPEGKEGSKVVELIRSFNTTVSIDLTDSP
ncbi:hypothetical protein JIN85_02545 [Luteolibacter pohnpeiensis]|uniref:Uncharacterized protein n=1 Tax=Luteolibacter pohnpeiensis TaxID=454153 RepID=A0A934S114_9BACT|nr:hypothetical protein [Luteolibacter pohnpeiensis]MBK1881275.1 hypothetical protein [Luteolibacter pohnpeiensis]